MNNLENTSMTTVDSKKYTNRFLALLKILLEEFLSKVFELYSPSFRLVSISVVLVNQTKRQNSAETEMGFLRFSRLKIFFGRQQCA